MGIKNWCQKNKFFVYFLAITLIGFKLLSISSGKIEPYKKPTKDVWLNVFVHGIMSIKPHISWNNFILFLKDEIVGTLYEKTVDECQETLTDRSGLCN